MDRDLIITNAIIHGFTITHAIIAGLLGPAAGAALTPMTIGMVVAICGQYKRNDAIKTAMATMSVFMGFIVGTIVGEFFLGVIPGANAIVSAAITETLGWVVYYIVRENISEKDLVHIGYKALKQRASEARKSMKNETKKLKKAIAIMKTNNPADYDKYKQIVKIISNQDASIDEKDDAYIKLDALLQKHGI